MLDDLGSVAADDNRDAPATCGAEGIASGKNSDAKAPASLQRSERDQTGMLDVRSTIGVFASPDGRHAVKLPELEYPDALNRAIAGANCGHAGSSLVAVLPPIYPEWLGTRRFTSYHGCRFPYVIGAMARGITTARMVVEAAKHGLMGFFGAAGLRPPIIAEAIGEIRASLGPTVPWGSNLIHTPGRQDRERAIVDLYLEKSVTKVSASAFMHLSPEIVRYSAHGLTIDAAGKIVRGNHVFAKISRPEIAEHFMAPPPPSLLRELAAAGRITQQQAEIQSRLPVAEDVTVESDSGGHTDNRPLTAVFPIIASLRDGLAEKHGYGRPIRLGAAGGLGTPQAVAAAFQLGADYVLTGSINQSAVESGLSEAGRSLLADCDFADVMMAPAADMFERGGKVQVLKRGTMFPIKAQKLYEIYRRNDSFAAISAEERAWLESQIFMGTCAEAWEQTRAYHASSDPDAAATADGDPKLQLALTFRRYLFMTSRWACEGSVSRRSDFQIWCGPAMGSFNEWTRGSFLEQPENRTVGQLALNLLEGACVATRIQQLRLSGIDVADHLHTYEPKRIALG